MVYNRCTLTSEREREGEAELLLWRGIKGGINESLNRATGKSGGKLLIAFKKKK